MSGSARAGHSPRKDDSLWASVPTSPGITRRNLLKTTGVLVVGFSLLGPEVVFPQSAAAQPGQTVPSDWLDSWLAIAEDGSVTLFTGKVDVGTGVETAMAQIAAEELDVAFSRVKVVMGDTALTVDQGVTAGSQSIASGGRQVRQAAAEARAALLELAADRLGTPVDDLVVKDGVVSLGRDSATKVTYGELVGGRRFSLSVAGTATVKSPEDYTIVGQPVARLDIPSKVTGQAMYVQDVRLPGMLHGRVVRPSGIGSMLIDVDRSSVSDIPGLVDVVVRGNFVGVVAEREEQAIRAAEQLKVTWSDWAGLPSMSDIYETARNTRSNEQVVTDRGDVEAALSGAAKHLQATYLFPFQTHGSIGPSCAVADVRDGQATLWSGTSGSHGLVQNVAQLVDLPADKVRIIWVQGSGSYGTNGASDVTLDAAVLSKAIGQPVRTQWMRADEHQWSTAGPAMVIDEAAGLDSQGNVVAWDYQAYTPSHYYSDRIAEHLVNREPTVPAGPPDRATPWGGESRMVYGFEGSMREVVHQLQQTPLSSQPLRAPGQVATTFAVESFMDELAAAAEVDPLAFRLRYLTAERPIAVLRAAAERASWEARPSPKHDLGAARMATGRGIALVQRPGGSGPNTFVAMVAEVEVDRQTGEVRVQRFVVAHDCGLIVNPDGVRNQVEGNIIQTTSRTLFEELEWDARNVTSVDWRSYPILTFANVPDIDIVLIDRPELPASGVGEPASCPVAAAIANAVFDATGVRLREVPFTPERVTAGLSSEV
jgi:nicotinate dehydrogenase subunit B